MLERICEKVINFFCLFSLCTLSVAFGVRAFLHIEDKSLILSVNLFTDMELFFGAGAYVCSLEICLVSLVFFRIMFSLKSRT